MTQCPAPGNPTATLPFAFGGPVGRGRLRASSEDFEVDELLGYAASGAGEHVFLVLRKRDLNTQDLARRIARLAGVAQTDIGYAGLKDKIAVTTQSFSARLAGKPAPDWSVLEDENVHVLSAQPHDRKIRRGSLRGNRFQLRLRDVAGHRSDIERRLNLIEREGVPNYFGSQRFGIEGRNLQLAHAFFSAQTKRLRRDQRSLLMSAVRGWLFNLVLAERVRQQTWNQPLAGDVFQLDGAQQTFAPEPHDPKIPHRVKSLDIHPTGPLAGRASRAKAPTGDVAGFEQQLLSDHAFWTEGLERKGLDAGRRALRMRVHEFVWSFAGDDLILRFRLDAGGYATTLLREVLDIAQ